MSTGQNHLERYPIPEGFQIYERMLSVTGISFRRKDAAAFAKGKKLWLEFEREPGNKYDPNAIKLIGCSKRFLGVKRRFIGYIPKETSKLIVERNYIDKVLPRLDRTYVGYDDFVEIRFQIIGPKGEKDNFYQFSNNKK